jgi:hypothetical protein
VFARNNAAPSNKARIGRSETTRVLSILAYVKPIATAHMSVKMAGYHGP